MVILIFAGRRSGMSLSAKFIKLFLSKRKKWYHSIRYIYVVLLLMELRMRSRRNLFTLKRNAL